MLIGFFFINNIYFFKNKLCDLNLKKIICITDYFEQMLIIKFGPGM